MLQSIAILQWRTAASQEYVGAPPETGFEEMTGRQVLSGRAT
jgi:hypothetical protein